MNDYRTQQFVSIQALRTFPRSTALITTAVSSAISLDPVTSLITGIAVWIVIRLLVRFLIAVFPNIVDLRLWSCCQLLVLPVSFWLLKYPVSIVAAAVAIMRGADAVETAAVVGGFIALDFFMIRFLGL